MAKLKKTLSSMKNTTDDLLDSLLASEDGGIDYASLEQPKTFKSDSPVYSSNEDLDDVIKQSALQEAKELDDIAKAPTKPNFTMGEGSPLSRLSQEEIQKFRTQNALKQNPAELVGESYVPKSNFDAQVERLEPSTKMVSETPDVSSKLSGVDDISKGIQSESKLNDLVRRINEMGPKASGPLAKLAKYAGPVGEAAAAAQSITEYPGDVANAEKTIADPSMPMSKKIGSGLKSMGDAALISSPFVAGIGTPIAGAATATAGLGAKLAGEYLDPQGEPLNPEYFNSKNFYKTPADDKDLVTGRSDDELRQLSKQDKLAYASEIAKQYGQDPALFLAQIDQESSFNPRAVSKTGAKGLGQMFPAAFEDVKGVDPRFKNISYDDLVDPKNWKLQLQAAAAYNNILKDRHGLSSDEDVLRSYHDGNPDTRSVASDDYIDKINQKSKYYRELLTSRSPASEGKMGDLLDFGPYSNDENYETKLAAQERLKNLSEEPESFPYVPSGDGRSKSSMSMSSSGVGGMGKDEMPQAEEQTGFTENTVEALKQAQERQNLLQNMAFINQALGKIGGGIAGAVSGVGPAKTDVSDTLSDAMGKMATREVANLKERQDKEKDDPNSRSSKQSVNMAKQLLRQAGLSDKVVEGMSFNDIEKRFPGLMQMVNTKENAEARKEAATLRREEIKTDRQTKSENKNLDWLTATSTRIKPFADTYSKALQAADIAKGSSGKNPAEDITMLYNFVKALDPDSAVREGEVTLASSIASLKGKMEVEFNRIATGKGDAIDKKTVNNLKKEIIRIADVSKDAYNKRVNIFKEQARARKIDDDSFNKQVDPFASSGSEYAASTNSNMLKVSNGKETLMIDPSDLKAAEKDGYKVIK